jgi:predicted nucleic acid-binding protein
MALVALDTNGYVEIVRGGARASAIREAIAVAKSGFVLLMPVMAELLQGARSPSEAARLRQRFLDPVPERRRVAATDAEWAGTGELVSAMLRAGHDGEELALRNFWLDVHLAYLCRSRGIVLLTDDGDHARIRAHARHTPRALPV